MSMAAPMYRLETIIGGHDVQDMEKLASFLVALSLTNMERLGVRGNGTIRLYRGHYALVADNGALVGGANPGSAGLMRCHVCMIEDCYKETWNFDSRPAFCQDHKVEFLILDESKDDAA